MRSSCLGTLVHVVLVDVHVTAGPHEFAGFRAPLLRDRAGEQRVGGDVEGDAQEHVSGALIELGRESLPLAT